MSSIPVEMPLAMSAPAEGPLSASHMRELGEAGRRAKKIRRAGAVAAFDGWTTVLFGAVALVGGLWDVPALLLGIGLCGAAMNGLHARKALLRFETGAAARLAVNQLILAGIIAAYCLWNIRQTLTGHSAIASISSSGDAGTDALLADVGGLARNIAVMVYGAVIVLTGLIQGLTGVYYLSRRRHIETYRKATPEWILRLHSQESLG